MPAFTTLRISGRRSGRGTISGAKVDSSVPPGTPAIITRPSGKVRDLLRLVGLGRETFQREYDKIDPSPDEVGEFIIICGRLAQIPDNAILASIESQVRELNASDRLPEEVEPCPR